MFQVWSDELKKCVSKFSEILTDDDLYAEARLRTDQGNHQEALDLLWRIKDQKQAKVLNYIGYNTRKLGRIKEGIDYYHRALALDPNYSRAREYLGEGYLQTGDLTKAEGELSEIKNRCGKKCDEYRQLAKAILEYKSGVN
jgi:tetratricopeptide (TPR) repeat protein